MSGVKIIENGLGVFEITPEESRNYFVQLLLNNNDTIAEPLPAISESGLMLRSKVSANNQLIIDIINKNLNQEQKYKLVLKSQDFKTQNERSINLVNEVSQFTFPIKNFVSGINYIMLEDESENIVKCYAFFNAVNDNLDLSINTQKINYSPRELVKLNLKPSNLNTGDFLNLSISVVKKGTKNYPNKLPTYILNNPQLLTSYLQSTNINKQLSRSEIDILMIYFNHEIMSSDYIDNLLKKPLNNFQWIPETRDVSISGIVLNKATNTPVPNISVHASVFKNNPQFHINSTNKKGEFVFSLNNFIKNQDVFLLPKTPRLNEFEIRINNDFSHNFPNLSEVSLSNDTTNKILLEEMFINLQAGQSFKTETGKIQLPTHHFPQSFAEPQITILMDDYISPPNLETAIREFVPAVKTHKNKGQYSLSITNNRDLITYHNPLIIVDNISILDINDLLEIPIRNIVRIDIHKYPFILGDNIIKGVFMITTNTNNFGGVTMPKGSIFLEYQTISPSYAFDPQTYNNEEKKSSSFADFRNLLYWNPDLTITAETSLSFYTSDHYSEYDIIVRGVSANGKTFYKKSSFTVKK